MKMFALKYFLERAYTTFTAIFIGTIVTAVEKSLTSMRILFPGFCICTN